MFSYFYNRRLKSIALPFFLHSVGPCIVATIQCAIQTSPLLQFFLGTYLYFLWNKSVFILINLFLPLSIWVFHSPVKKGFTREYNRDVGIHSFWLNFCRRVWFRKFLLFFWCSYFWHFFIFIAVCFIVFISKIPMNR